jgi:hypothetical protein
MHHCAHVLSAGRLRKNIICSFQHRTKASGCSREVKDVSWHERLWPAPLATSSGVAARGGAYPEAHPEAQARCHGTVRGRFEVAGLRESARR